MTKKQTAKFAETIWKYQLIVSNSKNPKEVQEAKQKIVTWTEMLLQQPDGLKILLEIDDILCKRKEL